MPEVLPVLQRQHVTDEKGNLRTAASMQSATFISLHCLPSDMVDQKFCKVTLAFSNHLPDCRLFSLKRPQMFLLELSGSGEGLTG